MVWTKFGPGATVRSDGSAFEDLRLELQVYLKQVIEECFRNLGDCLIDDVRNEVNRMASKGVHPRIVSPGEVTPFMISPRVKEVGAFKLDDDFDIDQERVDIRKTDASVCSTTRVNKLMSPGIARMSLHPKRHGVPRLSRHLPKTIAKDTAFRVRKSTASSFSEAKTKTLLRLPTPTQLPGRSLTTPFSDDEASPDNERHVRISANSLGIDGAQSFGVVQFNRDGYAPLSTRCEIAEEVTVIEDTPRSERTLARQCNDDNEYEVISHRQYVQTLVTHPMFEGFTAFVVVINALMLGLETDQQSRGGAGPTLSVILNGSEAVFCLVFLVELGLRLFAFRSDFFLMETWAWNVFDLTAVSLQVIEQFVHMLMNLSVQMSLSFMNFIRVLHLVRILRLLRLVKLVEQLRTIMSSILASLTALCWTLLLLLMLMYIVSVFFTQIILELPEDSTHEKKIKYWYGHLARSLLTMFEVIAGGVSWDEVVAPLNEDISPAVGVLFCIYVAFCEFAMLNMATGVFVDRAMRKAQEDTDTYTANHISDMFFNDLFGADSDGVTEQEFIEKMDAQEMKEYFRSINVDPSETKALFALLDVDGSGLLNAEELVNGCLRLRGSAKALDLQELMTMTHRLSNEVLGNQEQLINSVQRLEKAMCADQPVRDQPVRVDSVLTLA